MVNTVRYSAVFSFPPPMIHPDSPKAWLRAGLQPQDMADLSYRVIDKKKGQRLILSDELGYWSASLA